MIVRDFQQGDLDGEWAEGLGAPNVREDSVRMTVVDGDEIIAIGGAIACKEVVFWMQVKKNIKHTLSLVRMIKDSIGIIMEKLGVDKAMAIVREDFTQGHRTLQLLGFKLTGDIMEHDDIKYDWYEIWHSF